MKTKTLTPIPASEIKEPGIYLCHPVVAGFGPQPLMLVEVRPWKKDPTYLVYSMPGREGDLVVTTSSHTFFEVPKVSDA